MWQSPKTHNTLRDRPYSPTFFLNETFSFVGGWVNFPTLLQQMSPCTGRTHAQAGMAGGIQHVQPWWSCFFRLCGGQGWSLARTSLCEPYPVAPFIIGCLAHPTKWFICGRPDRSEQLDLRRIHKIRILALLWLLPFPPSQSGSFSCTFCSSWSSSSLYM